MTISQYCRLAVFDHMIVALDLKRSRYFLYDHACSTVFAAHYLDRQEITKPTALKPLIDDRIIDLGASQSQLCRQRRIADYRNMRFDAFDTGTWGSRTLGNRRISRFEFPHLLRVMRSGIMLKLFGLSALSVLELLPRKCRFGIAPSPANPDDMIERYLSASRWSPFRVTCLPLSLTLAVHLRESNLPAQLVIGVRPTPFVSHAWVEIGEQVFGDDQHLKKSYGEIYRTRAPRRTAIRHGNLINRPGWTATQPHIETLFPFFIGAMDQ